jgi:hypothetical protein
MVKWLDNLFILNENVFRFVSPTIIVWSYHCSLQSTNTRVFYNTRTISGVKRINRLGKVRCSSLEIGDLNV